MRAYDTIRRKRDGERLSPEALRAFVEGYTRGEVPDYQAAAFCMAVYFQGMDAEELAVWTDAMLHSGEVVDLSHLPGRKVDKHSTGGVGDKVSICLAPIVAACGVRVPMISGRGLGHTGGTLDKLEAIPGFRVDVPPARFAELVGELGFCLAGQTETLAPADRKLYALRDVTATVESIPLIASSILSKKLAEGIDGLVLDVKVGRGAFMKKMDDARLLARTLVALGKQMGTDVVALLTDMDQPLGRTVGNALETREAFEILTGGGPADLVEITVTLAAEMLCLGGVAEDLEAGRTRARKAIGDGSAYERMKRVIEAQGGDAAVLAEPGRLPTARRVVDVASPVAGWVAGLDAEAIGRTAMVLGAGRATKDDVIDPAVGIVLHKKVGDEVSQGEALCELHVNDESSVEAATRSVLAAYDFADERFEHRPLVLGRMGGSP
jgi:pyrimidine-nucleoside phosphorylase